jgi:hypothetical protein
LTALQPCVCNIRVFANNKEQAIMSTEQGSRSPSHVVVRRALTAFLCAAVVFAGLPAMAAESEATPPQRAAVTLEPGNGLVMARVVANRSVGDYFNKWHVLVVRNLATKKKHRLFDASPRASVQSVFVSSLPPGDYEVVEVGAQTYG